MILRNARWGMFAAFWFALAACSAPQGGGTTAAPAAAKPEGLVPFTVVGVGIPQPLTSKPGNPAEGKKVATGMRLGNCLACHKMPIPEEEFHGDVGPDLRGVAGRFPEAVLRLRVVDAKRINPGTSMPAFYKVQGLHRVVKNREGAPMLTAQQVEDLVAYLLTLK